VFDSISGNVTGKNHVVLKKKKVISRGKISSEIQHGGNW